MRLIYQEGQKLSTTFGFICAMKLCLSIALITLGVEKADAEKVETYQPSNLPTGDELLSFEKGSARTVDGIVTFRNATSSRRNCAQPYGHETTYKAGDWVSNESSNFRCKKNSHSDLCSGVAWAYAPGSGSYWQDVWDFIGPCGWEIMASLPTRTQHMPASAPRKAPTSTHASHLGRLSSNRTVSAMRKDKQGQSMRFPTLYDEADDMLQVSLLIYAYASLRKYASQRPAVYKEEKLILNDEPVTGRDIYRFFKNNRKVLKTEEDFQNEYGIYTYEQLQTLLKKGKKSLVLIAFDDKNPDQLVYGIATNKVQKRITVAFRGTASSYDYITNVKVAGKTVENPLYKETQNQKQTFKVHSGFYDYLFATVEGEKTKFQIILDQLIQARNIHPNYKVYVTGQSLGASLATLFAFFASTPQNFEYFSPYPVTCVSIASPKVGDNDWRNAFMLQEKQRRVRILRVTNFGDLIPKVPQVSFPIPFLYAHVGVHLQLYKDDHRFSYPKNGESSSIDLAESVITPIRMATVLNLHSFVTYNTRLEVSSEDLKNQYLDYFYADDAFVGSYSNV